MSSRPRLAAITSGTLLLMAGCPSRPATAVSDLELHRRAIVIDTHSDCTQRIAYDGIDFATAQPDMQVDLPKMRAGGLDAQFFSIFVGPWRTGPEGYYAEALKQFDAVHAMIRANPDTIAWARTAADVRANAERKRISALFGVEGGHALLPGGETDARAPAHVSRARRPLPDPHLVHREPARRLLGRRQRRPGADRRRSPDHRRDGASRHDGRRLARLRSALLGRHPLRAKAGHRLPLLGPGAGEPSAQHERRHAAGGGAERRRGVRELRLRLSRPGLLRARAGRLGARARARPPAEGAVAHGARGDGPAAARAARATR